MTQKRIIVACLAVLLVAFLYVIQSFLTPMLVAAIIVVMFYPIYSRINAKFKKWPRLASFVTTLLVLVIIIIPSSWIAGTLANQLYGLVGQMDLKATFANLFSAQFYQAHIQPWILNIENRYHIRVDLLGLLTNFGKQLAQAIYDYSPSVLMGTATFVFNFVLMLFGIFFLFLEGPKLIKIFMDLSPLRETYEDRLSKRIKDTIDASVYGYLVTGLVQALIATAFYAFLGIKPFVVLGVMTFFMSVVPVIGATGIWLPVCIWLFLQGNTWQGVVMLVGGAGFISLVDNFLKPIIIQGKTHIHPLLIFFSIFGGIKLFGPLGILFGPVITALLIAIINIYREEFV